MPKKCTSFTLSNESLELLKQLAQYLGVSKTGVLELIIREKARSENVKSTQD